MFNGQEKNDTIGEHLLLCRFSSDRSLRHEGLNCALATCFSRSGFSSIQSETAWPLAPP